MRHYSDSNTTVTTKHLVEHTQSAILNNLDAKIKAHQAKFNTQELDSSNPFAKYIK